MSNVLKVTSATFEEEVLKSNIPVLVDFYADWCGPCKMLGPSIDELAKEFAGKVKIVKLNIDDSGDIASRYGVMSIPTLIVYKNGDVFNRSMGMQPKPKLVNQLTEAL